jgi:hypothetical protein
MSEEFFKVSAEQLRQPHGDLAIQVGEKMNEINIHIHHNTFEALIFLPTTAFSKLEWATVIL